MTGNLTGVSEGHSGKLSAEKVAYVCPQATQQRIMHGLLREKIYMKTYSEKVER
jgi:hypothetical protein